MKRILEPNFEKRGGTIPVVFQHHKTRQILMLGYVDRAGFLETIRTNEAVYFSTSRNERWKKGETSGCIQKVYDILIDCDGDALIYVGEQIGEGACHTGAESCFFRSVCLPDADILHAPRKGEKEALNIIEVED